MGNVKTWTAWSLLALACLGAMPDGLAQDGAAVAVEVVAEAPPAPLTAEDAQANLNIVWTCVAAFLVFFMQAGFAMVETGFTRAKNAVNIIMKNLMNFCIRTGEAGMAAIG